MTRDHHTNTPDQAAKADRAAAWDDRERDRDIDEGVVPEHACTSPNPERCLVCALAAVVAEQKMFAAERARIDAMNNREWWSA